MAKPRQIKMEQRGALAAMQQLETRSAEKLGQTPPSNRQLLALRVMGVVAPPASAGILRRILGILIVIAAIVLALVLGWAIVNLVALPFGGIGAVAWFWGFMLVAIVLGVLVFLGRRRQKVARGKAAEARAAQFKR